MIKLISVLALSCLAAVAFAEDERAGAAFFEAQVLPKLLANGCANCHMPAPGYVRPAITYDDLLPYLAMGQARDDNVLIYKLANQRSFAPDRPSHIGGQRCADENSEPCSSIMSWWDTEFGDRQ
jgi:hypothetical protein